MLMNCMVIGDETNHRQIFDSINELNKYFTNITANIENERDTNVHFKDENLKNFVSSRLNTEETTKLRNSPSYTRARFGYYQKNP